MAPTLGFPRAMAALLLTLSVSSTLLPLVHSKTVKLTNFEFENRVLPVNNTVVVSANPSGTLGFGTIRVVTNVLRESEDANSEVLGSVVGLVSTLKADSNGNSGLYLTFNFVYATEELNGTIGVQGLLDFHGNGELVVTGGSGDFRLAQGWVETTLVDATDPNTHVVFKNVVHLVFPDVSNWGRN